MKPSPPLNFEKVSPKKVSDFILDQLEEAIILKELLPEDRLPTERELSEMFSVSRLAIREALSQLEEKGLIEKRVGVKGGTFVLPVTVNSHRRSRMDIQKNWDDMVKTFEYRRVIEPEAAYLAAKRITDSQLNQLEDYLKKSMEENCPRELFRSLDVKFHLEIAKASHNHYFEKAVSRIRTKINPVLDLMPYSHEVRMTTFENHRLLLEALRNRDSIKSKELMARHIENAEYSINLRVFHEKE